MLCELRHEAGQQRLEMCRHNSARQRQESVKSFSAATKILQLCDECVLANNLHGCEAGAFSGLFMTTEEHLGYGWSTPFATCKASGGPEARDCHSGESPSGLEKWEEEVLDFIGTEGVSDERRSVEDAVRVAGAFSVRVQASSINSKTPLNSFNRCRGRFAELYQRRRAPAEKCDTGRSKFIVETLQGWMAKAESQLVGWCPLYGGLSKFEDIRKIGELAKTSIRSSWPACISCCFREALGDLKRRRPLLPRSRV